MCWYLLTSLYGITQMDPQSPIPPAKTESIAVQFKVDDTAFMSLCCQGSQTQHTQTTLHLASSSPTAPVNLPLQPATPPSRATHTHTHTQRERGREGERERERERLYLCDVI